MFRELEWEKLLFSKRRKYVHDSPESLGTGIGREEIERDYDRILFCAPIRRLADKTQVFPMEANDSIRTRLTHSHEVSNLARSIGIRLAFKHRQEVFEDRADDLRVDRTVPALLAAVGLAHDLGNPPFGHQGEFSIRRWFRDNRKEDAARDFLEFDGNCQTFRLLTRLQILNDDYGLNLTYATLAAMLKYPEFSDSEPKRFKKFGIFDSERDIAHDVWEHTGLGPGIRHPLAYVMEACDDIAYSVIDAEDIVKKGYASFNDLIDHLRSSCTNDDKAVKDVVDSATSKNREFRNESLSSSELNDLSMQMFRVKAIAIMVESATETFVDAVPRMMSGSIGSDFELIGRSASGELCRSLKEFDDRHGFRNPAVLRLELKGDTYIRETMDMLWRGIVEHDKDDLDKDDPFAQYAYGRISENYRRVCQGSERADRHEHLLCDAISGMTEKFLVTMHRDLTALKP